MSQPGLITPSVHMERREDGSIILSSANPLKAYAARISDPVVQWAKSNPDRVALADRKGPDASWRQVTYAQFEDRSARLGQALLSAGLGPDRPLLLVSENRIEAAVALFAAYRVGVPIAPVTPAYSAGRGDSARLETILSTLRPGLAIVDNAAVHSAALVTADPGLDIISMLPFGGYQTVDQFTAPNIEASFYDAEAAVGPNHIAKVMFTSGSTGTPKGAINTHRMLASNVQAIVQGWQFLEEEPPILVDWLPWNHTFGGNYVLNTVLSTGGTLYIDDGKITPENIVRCLENAAEVRPNLHINVPRGLDLMSRALGDNPALAKQFFERLRIVMFASSGLPARIREQWRGLIDTYGQRPVDFVSAWGATETAPLATVLNFEAPEINNIGVPADGTLIKLSPVGDRLEIRVKGPNVTPGYLKRPDLTSTFDEEGYWCSGDVGHLADQENPERGILISGRLAEDFKLASGIWVNVSGLRGQLIEQFAGLARDVVISGPQRDELGALIFLDIDQCRRVAKVDGDIAAMAEHPEIVARVSAVIERHNAFNSTNSRKIALFTIMLRNLDPSGGEVTEKGTVNQAAVLRRELQTCEGMHGRLKESS